VIDVVIVIILLILKKFISVNSHGAFHLGLR